MIIASTLLIRNRLSNYIKEKRNQKIEKQKLSRRGYRCPLSSGRRGPHSKTYITSRGDTNESVKGKKPSRYALEGLNPRESEPSPRNWPKKRSFNFSPWMRVGMLDSAAGLDRDITTRTPPSSTPSLPFRPPTSSYPTCVVEVHHQEVDPVNFLRSEQKQFLYRPYALRARDPKRPMGRLRENARVGLRLVFFNHSVP